MARSGRDEWLAPEAPPTDAKRLFGGLLIGQAVFAATQETRRCHALHAFFVDKGVAGEPFHVAAEHTRDGANFSRRRFEIRQGERLVLAGYSSHHDGNDGPQRQTPMPDVPGPESLEDWAIARARRAERLGVTKRRYLAEQMLDVRRIDNELPGPDDRETAQAMWFRPRREIRGRRELHQAILGFASDVGLVDAGLRFRSAAGNPALDAASLDHSVWFHNEAPADDWLLHVTYGSIVANGREFSRATIFTPDGVLMASVAQEFLARFASR